MTNRARLLLVGIGALATVAAPSAEPPPPLAATREQLRALPKDGVAGPDQRPPGDWRDGLPPVALPPPLRPASPAPVARPEPAKREAAPARNWLLDGFANERRQDRAGRGDAARAGRAGEGAGATDDEPLDPTDPDYLVKAYEQRRRMTAREAARMETERGEAAGRLPAGPLAPLMQEWLARSPVRGMVEANGRGDQARARGEPAGAAVGLPGRVETERMDPNATVAAGVEEIGGGGRLGPTENPYLAALTLPGAAAAGAGADQGALPAMPPASAASAGAGDGAPPLPAATPPAAGRKPPRAPWEEDRKFFPQTKKF